MQNVANAVLMEKSKAFNAYSRKGDSSKTNYLCSDFRKLEEKEQIKKQLSRKE
jgi:hypothetical protein